MNDKELSEKLKDQAIGLGLCQEWTKGWGNPDKNDLCEKYIKGIDFCILNRYPSNELIKREFSNVRERYNIFVDDKNVFLTNPKWSIYNGKCDCTVTFMDCGIGEMYVKDESVLHLTALDNSIVYITLLDDAKIDIISSPYSRVFVYTNNPDNIMRNKVEGKLVIKPYTVK